MAVLEAYEPIERRWHERVSTLDVAVDEIPRISPKDPDSVQWPPEVVADGPIALARLIPAGVPPRGRHTTSAARSALARCQAMDASSSNSSASFFMTVPPNSSASTMVTARR